MGVLDLVKGVGNVTDGISKKTKEMSESSNLKKKIAYEQDRIQEIYAEIGEKYYKNPDGDKAPLLELCEDIDRRKNRIKNMSVQQTALKGKRVCPKCKAVFDDSNEFCGKCGTKLTVLDAE
ncbi:MAG: zinc ribbon domain-containing protein [Oscillospiraceae bacterium]|nr:zinc ribbon domain-containing protein [Oscillospiraceae bacterium]